MRARTNTLRRRAVGFFSRQTRLAATVVAFAGLMLTSGCGPRIPPGKVVLVGVVTLDGGPLPEGHRSHLLLQARDSRSSATARVDRDGRFKVVIDPGEYDVVADVRDGEDRTDPARGPIAAQSLIAKKYESLMTSGLAVTVKPGVGPVTFDLSR